MKATQVKRIAVAVVERDGDEVLIGRRPPAVPLGGLWEFPGGKVRPHESYEAAAIRECLEETGLAVAIVREISRTTHAYDHATLAMRFYQCVAEEGQSENTPLGSFRWVKKSALRDYEFPAANQALLEALLANP